MFYIAVSLWHGPSSCQRRNSVRFFFKQSSRFAPNKNIENIILSINHHSLTTRLLSDSQHVAQSHRNFISCFLTLSGLNVWNQSSSIAFQRWIFHEHEQLKKFLKLSECGFVEKWHLFTCGGWCRSWWRWANRGAWQLYRHIPLDASNLQGMEGRTALALNPEQIQKQNNIMNEKHHHACAKYNYLTSLNICSSVNRANLAPKWCYWAHSVDVYICRIIYLNIACSLRIFLQQQTL